MKISIIVPVYNGEKYLERCLESIINQTFKNWELILIDDGSTDSTNIICDEYAEREDRIRVIHKVNEGVSLARNLGLEIADGEYITFVDADDWIDSDFFEEVVKEIEQMGVPIVITGYLKKNNHAIINRFNGTRKEIFDRRKIQKEFFLCNKFSWVIYAKFYKKEVINTIRFNSNLKIGEDMLFCWKVLNNVEKVGFLPLYKYYYDMSASETMTSEFSLKWFGGIKVKKKLYNEVKNDKRLKLLAKTVYVVEMAVLAKKAIKTDKYNVNRLIKLLQKEIRRNFYLILLYPLGNIMSFRQMLGILFFCLPYRLCKLLKNTL